jgi:hypothetical protein
LHEFITLSHPETLAIIEWITSSIVFPSTFSKINFSSKTFITFW